MSLTAALLLGFTGAAITLALAWRGVPPWFSLLPNATGWIIALLAVE